MKAPLNLAASTAARSGRLRCGTLQIYERALIVLSAKRSGLPRKVKGLPTVRFLQALVHINESTNADILVLGTKELVTSSEVFLTD